MSTAQVVFPTFGQRPEGVPSGGNNRSDQLAGLLAEAGIDPSYANVDPAQGSRLAGAWAAVRHLRPVVRPRIRPTSWRAVQSLGYFGKVWRSAAKAMAAHPAGRCVVIESQYLWPIAYWARDRGLPWVAVPQNIESLCRGRDFFFGRDQMAGLRFETEMFGTAAAAFCIGYEEQFVLTNMGVRADVLPYHPPAELERSLAAVRAARGAAEREHVLVLGSAGYGPTLDGMRHLLSEVLPAARGGARVVVAGRGTETLRGFTGPGVDVLGTVPPARLDELLRDARAVLLYQRRGGGALTRIPEALLAGVPVIANTFAARSAVHRPGVHTFDTPGELADLLRADLPPPPPPPRPEAAERRFVDTIRRLIGAAPRSAAPTPTAAV